MGGGVPCAAKPVPKRSVQYRLFAEYYDKYGAPVHKDNSWMEGYHVVEKRLAQHYNVVVDNKLNLPLVAGMGGGVHLYKTRHGSKPWNWTGWIPRQKRWLSQGTFFSNRWATLISLEK